MTDFSLFAIAFGGAFGAVSRFLVSREMGRFLGDYLPYGTITVNVLGSFMLGWLASIFLNHPDTNQMLRLGVLVGFFGAFTTFSTFSYESIQLMLNGAFGRALLNVLINTVCSLAFCYAGIQLARMS